VTPKLEIAQPREKRPQERDQGAHFAHQAATNFEEGVIPQTREDYAKLIFVDSGRMRKIDGSRGRQLSFERMMEGLLG
jgi:hypothetical protein